MAEIYTKMIQRLSADDVDTWITNAQGERAAAVIAELARRATKEVLLFSRALNPERAFGTDVVKKAFRDFLAKNQDGRIWAILQDMTVDAFKEHPIYKCLTSDEVRDTIKGTIEIRKAVGGYATSESHFLIQDRHGLRVEVDHSKLGEARINFNKPSIAGEYAESFLQAFKNSNGQTIFQYP